MSEAPPTAPVQPQRFGAFLGVFTPTVLTILGVIMYLRLGWVVGNAGLLGALVIIGVANLITLLTTLSMSTLATNMRVGVGGAYFLISRSFGLEVGGAIGIPLYVSQVLSVTLYAFGLAESLGILARAAGFAWTDGVIQGVAALIVILVSLVASRSTELTLKLQLPIMVLIGASIVALLLGVEWGASHVPLVGSFERASPMLTFAVFFPAVTGILTGLSLSGDLEDPSVAIPRGGLAAVAVGALVYLTLPFALAHGASVEALQSDDLLWTSVALGGSWLVMPGMWGAILSSAFGAILSAPRTLQALATDRLAPPRFGETDESGAPVLGLYLSGGLALLAVGLGSLDAVATVVTMFFLTTYGALNAVAALEALIGDPSFRPRISMPWWAAFLGAAGCFGAMFAISAPAAIAAMAVEVAIFAILSRRSLEATWGDARGGLFLSASRALLMRLRDVRLDPRNWRPHLIVLTEDLTRDIPLVELADDLGQHRGIVTVCQLVSGDESMHSHAEDIGAQNKALLKARGIWDVFSEVDIVADYESGAVTVAQANGIAGLHSNTVCVGYHPNQGEGPERLARSLVLARRVARLGKCTLIVVPSEESKAKAKPGAKPKRPTLMIWWAGRQNNGDLMLLIAHLLSGADRWRNARIVLKSVVADTEDAERRRADFAKMIPEIRMDVRVDIVLRGDGDIREVIHSHSAPADLVFLGLGLPEAGEERKYADRLDLLLSGLPDAVLVRNAGEFSGRLV
jgi:amino acid transporter